MLFSRTRSIHSKVELLPFEEQYVTELDSVVKFTVLLKPELFPAASCARTLKEYAVAATKPVIFAEVPVTVPMFVLPWKISYPVTPTLSVEAVHESVAVVWVMFEAAKLVGAEGGCVSPPVPPKITV